MLSYSTYLKNNLDGDKMDVIRQIKNAMVSGGLLFGQNQAKGACEDGSAKVVILAANCPEDYVSMIKSDYPNIVIHQTRMVNRELGAACGKPFSVSTIAVVDAGKSTLLSLKSNV